MERKIFMNVINLVSDGYFLIVITCPRMSKLGAYAKKTSPPISTNIMMCTIVVFVSYHAYVSS